MRVNINNEPVCLNFFLESNNLDYSVTDRVTTHTLYAPCCFSVTFELLPVVGDVGEWVEQLFHVMGCLPATHVKQDRFTTCFKTCGTG